MSHTSRDDGSHLVVLDVTLEDGTEIRERALLDAGGAIIEAASPTAGIRYLRSDRAPESDVATRAPAPIRADLLGTHAVSSRALAEATAVTVRLGDEEDGERVIHRGREPSPAIRPHVDRVLERTRTAMSATPGATCVDYARAARRGLNDAGVPARLVTGWVAFAGEWRVHRWLEVRDGSDWIGVDPALNQRAIDATHVPLVHHSSTAVDISEIVLETVLVAALGAPPRVLRVER